MRSTLICVTSILLLAVPQVVGSEEWNPKALTELDFYYLAVGMCENEFDDFVLSVLVEEYASKNEFDRHRFEEHVKQNRMHEILNHAEDFVVVMVGRGAILGEYDFNKGGFPLHSGSIRSTEPIDWREIRVHSITAPSVEDIYGSVTYIDYEFIAAPTNYSDPEIFPQFLPMSVEVAEQWLANVPADRGLMLAVGFFPSEAKCKTSDLRSPLRSRGPTFRTHKYSVSGVVIATILLDKNGNTLGVYKAEEAQ